MALGYSLSSVTVNNTVYGMSAFGFTLAGKIDIFHGFTKVRRKDFSTTGISFYLRNNNDQKVIPVITGSLMRANDRGGDSFLPGGAFGIYLMLSDYKQFRFYVVPGVSIVKTNSRGSDAEVYGGLSLSINQNLSQAISVYLEPSFTFDSKIDPSIQLGIRTQFGKSAFRN